MKAEVIPGAHRFLAPGESGANYGLAVFDTLSAYPELRQPNQQVSQWRPSAEELARLNAGMPVHLYIIGTAHPAVAVEVPALHDAWRDSEAPIKRDYCPERLKPGGCQLHNVQCGFPRCNDPPCECNACASRRMVDENAGHRPQNRYILVCEANANPNAGGQPL